MEKTVMKKARSQRTPSLTTKRQKDMAAGNARRCLKYGQDDRSWNRLTDRHLADFFAVIKDMTEEEFIAYVRK